MSESIPDLLLRVWEAWKATSPVRQGAVTQEQYRLLRILKDEGPQQVNGLASRTGTTSSSVSTALKRLERGRMVRRARSKEDERVVSVSLTQVGQASLRSWREKQLNALGSLFDVLDSSEKDAMRRMLAKVAAGEGR